LRRFFSGTGIRGGEDDGRNCRICSRASPHAESTPGPNGTISPERTARSCLREHEQKARPRLQVAGCAMAGLCGRPSGRFRSSADELQRSSGAKLARASFRRTRPPATQWLREHSEPKLWDGFRNAPPVAQSGISSRASARNLSAVMATETGGGEGWAGQPQLEAPVAAVDVREVGVCGRRSGAETGGGELFKLGHPTSAAWDMLTTSFDTPYGAIWGGT